MSSVESCATNQQFQRYEDAVQIIFVPTPSLIISVTRDYLSLTESHSG